MIDNFEPRLFAEIVDAGDIDQVIERKFVPAEFRDFAQVACGNRVSRFTAKFSLVLNLLAERFA